MALSTKQLRELRQSPSRGNRVGKAIDLANVTQMDVADATGLPQPYISDVARNRYETITVDNAHKLAAYFGCRIEDLFPEKQAVSA